MKDKLTYLLPLVGPVLIITIAITIIKLVVKP
jgi:hypothetical protein